jgi:hypothetical protein
MPPLNIDFSSRFKAEAQALSEERKQQVAEAVARLRGTFGHAHLHTGLGIRRLRQSYFEFRAGRDMRVVFKLEGSHASMMLIGNHDDVRRFLKNS